MGNNVDKKEFIPYKNEDYENRYNSIFMWLVAISGVLLLFFPAIISNGGPGLCGFLIVLSITATIIMYNIKNGEQERIDNRISQIKKQNKALFEAHVEDLIKEQIGINAKIVRIVEKYEKNIQIGISNDTKKFIYVKSIFNVNSATTRDDINVCSFNDILKYEFIDNSTSQLISSSSVTGSNAGKAVLGAVAGGVLFGETTAGAVVGASGKRTTQTQYETKITKNYVLNIFINKLDSAIISIATQDRNKITEIISLLEYAINNKV